jgi:hypothetical protein
MIIIIPIFIVAGVFLGDLIDEIEYGDKRGTIFYSIAFLLFLSLGIVCFENGSREYPAAKYEISSVVTTKNVETQEGEHHFTHIEKDTLYIVSKK